MPESSFSNTCSLLPNTHHSLIELRTRDSTSALHLRAILSSESINKKHKDAKQEALDRPWKGHFLLYKSWNTQFECSSGLPWGRVHQVTPIFNTVRVCKIPQQCYMYGFGGDKYISGGRQIHKRNPQITMIDCIWNTQQSIKTACHDRSSLVKSSHFITLASNLFTYLFFKERKHYRHSWSPLLSSPRS